jgi:hypothetical protein
LENEASTERGIIDAGAELTGIAAAGAIGYFIGSPEAAAAAPLALVPVRIAIKEIAQRVLGNRERIRVGAALQYTAETYQERLADGDQVRTDAFFHEPPHGRSAAQDLAEGVLLAAQRSWEEKKVRHLGYLLGNIAFESIIDGQTANHALTLAQQLSWKQYVLLALIHTKDETPLPPGDAISGPRRPAWDAWSTFDELNQLITTNLIGGKPGTTPRLGLALASWELPDLRLSNGGLLLASLLRLDKITEEDRRPVRTSLLPPDQAEAPATTDEP